MKKILITGGAGFIGSHLCEYFVNNNFNVTCLDNLSSGNSKTLLILKKEKIFFLKILILQIHLISKMILILF